MASGVKWIKITTDIFDDEKIRIIEQMPDGDAMIVIWFKLLTYCGKSNNDGVFMLGKMAYTEDMLAMLLNRPIMTVKLALQTFESFGMIEVINDVITIPNWEKHQNTKGLEKIREDDRKRQAKHRAKQKAIVNGEVPLLEENLDTEDEDCIKSNGEVTDDLSLKKEKENKKKNNNTYDEEFDEFWKMYPRRVGKTAAKAKFIARMKEKEVTAGELIFAAQRYADECKRKGTEAQYIKHASTFLGPQKAYEDYLPSNSPEPPKPPTEPQVIAEVMTDEQLAELGYV